MDEGAEEDQTGGEALDLEGSRCVVCRGCRGGGGGAAEWGDNAKGKMGVYNASVSDSVMDANLSFLGREGEEEKNEHLSVDGAASRGGWRVEGVGVREGPKRGGISATDPTEVRLFFMGRGGEARPYPRGRGRVTRLEERGGGGWGGTEASAGPETWGTVGTG